MPTFENMHAPGSECAHLLPAAGFNLPLPPDAFRFNRVVARYGGDGLYLDCPRELDVCPKNHPWMPAAGTDTRMRSDVFRFSKVYPGSRCLPCKEPGPYTCLTGASHEMPYPCTGLPRYPPSKPSRHFDFRYPSGATGCNQTTHRRGHAPQDCQTRYPHPDELTLVQPARPRDCRPHPSLMETYQGDGPAPSNNQQHFRGYPGAATLSDFVGKRLGQGDLAPISWNLAARSGPGACGSCGPASVNPVYNSGFAAKGNCSLVAVQRPDKQADLTSPCAQCPQPYYPSNYICCPVFNRRSLLDCPEQDGPPADTYTFL